MSDIQSANHELSRRLISHEPALANSKPLRSSSRLDSNLRRLQPIGEHAYGGAAGFLYTARRYARTIKSSRMVAIYLSLNDEPVEFFVSGVRHRSMAVAFKPLVPRTIMDHGSGLICAALNPTHPNYRQFSIAPVEKVIALDRSAFSPLNDAIRNACLGDLDLTSGLELLSQIVFVAGKSLKIPQPLDARVVSTINRLHADANISLDQLASAVGLSYYRLSHLFSNSIGLSLRSYQLWLKLDHVWRLIEKGHNMTDIVKLAGFNDLPHMCHVFQGAFGVSLAHHLRNIANKMNFNLS